MEPIVDPIIRETMSYWCRLRHGRDMPSRADIDPCDIPSYILPQLLLIDVVDAGKRFRCRLVGTGLVKATGWDHTGRFIDDGDVRFTPPEAQRAYLGNVYDEVVATRQPLYTTGLYLNGRQVEGTVKRLIMPLSEDGRTVNMLLGVLTFVISQAGRKPRSAPRNYIEETRTTMSVCNA